MIAGVIVAVLLCAAGVGGYLVYRHLDSNITAGSVDADQQLRPSAGPSAPGPTHPADQGPAVNILVMGSDTRVGQGGEGDSAKIYSSAQSDVVMLVHLSADRQRALVLSIPRDTWVHIPQCTLGGTTHSARDAKFNEAFTLGGAARGGPGSSGSTPPERRRKQPSCATTRGTTSPVGPSPRR